MKKLLLTLGALLLFVAAPSVKAQGQQGNIFPQQGNTVEHRIGSWYWAAGYSGWQGYMLSGNSATGSQSVVIMPQGGAQTGTITLSDGSGVPLTSVFNTSTPIYILDGASETVTPSAVTIGSCPAGNLGVGATTTCATVTATFSNLHGQGAIIQSGDGGIEEAITDAGNNGGGIVNFERDCGNMTMNTGGVTTTSVNCQVPLNSVAVSASVFVVTTITTTATYGVGFAGNTTLYIAACAALTAGLNCSAKNVAPAESATGTSFALSPVLVTANAASGAGVVHVKVMGYSQVSSTH